LSDAPGSRPGYLPALDGLRAVAVAAVVAFHLGRLGGGFLGVDVFFVLSGFLITRILLGERERTGRNDLRRFWVRRARRLLPALLVVVPVVMLGSWRWLAAWRLPGIRTDALAALAYVANWRFIWSGQSYFAVGVGPSPFRHTWSLAVEEQFYVLWPLLLVGSVALFRRWRRPRTVVAVVAGAVTVLSATAMAVAADRTEDLTRLYYGTDTRVFALAVGGLLATGWDGWRARLEAGGERRAGLVANVGSLALVPLALLLVYGREDAVGFYRGGFQATAAVATVVVAVLGLGRGPVARVLSHPAPTWVGRRAYGLYLWSWPVQVLLRSRFPDLAPALSDLLVVGVTLALAAASFRYVEQPVMAGGLPWTPRSSASRAGGSLAAVVAVVVGVAFAVSAAAPAPPGLLGVSDEEARDAALADDGFEPLPDDGPTTTTATTPSSTTAPPTEDAAASPTVNDPGADPPFDPAAPVVATGAVDPGTVHGRPLRVLIVGDSVGWSLGWQVQAVEAAVDISNRAVIGCGLLPPEARWIGEAAGTRSYPDGCSVQAEAEARGMASGPDVVLLWLGAWEVFDQELDGRRLRVGSDEYGSLLEARLQARVDAARAAGAPTVMALVPCFDDRLAPEFRPERLDPERVAWVNERVRAVAGRNPGWVRLIDPATVLCGPDGTSLGVAEDGTVVREDGSHFDTTAVWFWDHYLATAIGAAFP